MDQNPSSSPSENHSSPSENSPEIQSSTYPPPEYNHIPFITDSINRLSLSDPNDSVLSKRVESAAKGQSSNLYKTMLKPNVFNSIYNEFDSIYNDYDNLNYYNMMNNQNGLSGRPGPSSNKSSLSGNGSRVFSGPGLNRPVQEKGDFYDPFGYSHGEHVKSCISDIKNNGVSSVYDVNNRANGSLYSGNDSFGSSFKRNNMFGPEPMYVPNGLRESYSRRPNIEQNRFIQHGDIFKENGFREQGETMHIKNNQVNRLFEQSFDQHELFWTDPVYSIPDGRSNAKFYLKTELRRNGLGRPVMYGSLCKENELGRVGPDNTMRSSMRRSLLGDVHSRYPLKDFRGTIEKMARSKELSGFLKQKIGDGADEDSELIFDEIKDVVPSLMVNYFGSTVVQKLFKVCRTEQISYVLCSLFWTNLDFIDLCCDNYGSIAMVKLLENLRTSNQRILFISALSYVVLKLCTDQNGLKVVKYCIDNFENVDVLINEIAGQCLSLATNKSGCCALQPCLSKADGETMERLMDNLGQHAVELSLHKYGNYVMQYILELNNQSLRSNLLGRLAGNYVSLSIDRCGSNVVEKCLVAAKKYEVAEIILEIMNSDDFAMVMKDQYGNYVIQKALEICQEMGLKRIRKILETCIMALYESLHCDPYGKRVLSKLKHCSRRF